MNIDPYRDRCALPDLEQQKLRRVSFCVDVEIAGAAQYVEDEPAEAKPPTPLTGESSLTKLGHQIEEKKKRKDQQQKKGEGEALKRPTAVVEEKETTGRVEATGEKLDAVKGPDSKTPMSSNLKEPTKKKEKKKKSEGERKERKDRKQKEALANGTIPAEIRREGSNSSTEQVDGADTPPKSQDRPTTDPLRIYRRCCQLRETPILKRIAEQISLPSACHIATPGILSVLDISGYWMQLPDVVTLGDYLAVVPVRKLILENCGLGDEAVRVILAGLLAAKTPEQAKHNKRLGRNGLGLSQGQDTMEQLGVIEKLSLKNNPKISQNGWRHIALFINMSQSLKGIDLSMIPFPEYSMRSSSIKSHHSHDTALPPVDMPSIIHEAIATRRAGSRLQELVMAECGLSTDCIGLIADGVTNCGLNRLGLASNNLSREGFEHVLRYVRSGKCEGLDIGGNEDLRNHLDLLVEALDEKNPLFALSLADCHLSPASLELLFPALVRLPNFRFIDLSHNRDLFATRPSALNLIRKYLPQFPILKRIHLLDVAMTSEHAIALAEVLPECRHLAHLNILENHLLSPLASAKTEASQEEACALYASLMAAVRVSDSLICIDVDVPSQDSSEIVKALAKQVVAYSLRNLERLPIQENSDSAIAAMAEPHGGEKGFTVPDILLHLVGHVDEFPENHDNDEPAPDDDYIVGGTGVVKALDICLKRAADGRRSSRDGSPMRSGTGTPQTVLQGSVVSKGKAKEMSKNLLGSARKIRGRLEPALVKEAQTGNEWSYSTSFVLSTFPTHTDRPSERLKFLDSTLEGMIQRFEDEYPETRLAPTPAANLDNLSENGSVSSSLENSSVIRPFSLDTQLTEPASPEEKDEIPLVRPASLSRRSSLTRRSSSPSLASRQAQEEGRMHRFGQRLKRDILRPEGQDYAHGTTGTEIEAEHIQDIRRRLETFEGSEIKEKVLKLGPEVVYNAIGASTEDLAEMEKKDPEGFQHLLEVRKYLALNQDEGENGTEPPAGIGAVVAS